jgi:SWI/SNF-related matrix-associated actin-dependent regulator 1 of chromatin subfamily A
VEDNKSAKVINVDEDEESEFSDSGSDEKSDSESVSSDSDNSHGKGNKRAKGKHDEVKRRGLAGEDLHNTVEDDVDLDYDVSTEDVGQVELKRKAKKVLDSCLSISAGLRKALNSWSTQATPSAPSTSSSLLSTSDQSSKSCVNLVSIEESHLARGELITQEDIQILCPTLTLKAYQLVGVNWLKLLDEQNINGVLADDMGLGKTVQTISFLGWRSLQVSNGGRTKRPHLIVVPASTLANWNNEFDKFCPSLRVIVYHGTQRERLELRSEIQGALRSGEIDAIITNYTIFERESNKDDRKFLYNLKFEYLILDEAHCLKNASTTRYSKLNSVRSKHRLLLSGTPVQNDIGELLALLSFLMPDTFSKSDCELLLAAFEWDQVQKNRSDSSIKKLRSMLAPFVLRRIKQDVLDQLTDKIVCVEKMPMFDSQRKVYSDLLFSFANMRHQSILRAEAEAKLDSILDVKKAGRGRKPTKKKSKVDVSDDGPVVVDDGDDEIEFIGASSESGGPLNNEPSGFNNLSSSESRHLFTSLRKAANHPLLLRVRYRDQAVLSRIAEVCIAKEHFGAQCDIHRVKEELVTFSDFDLHQVCAMYPEYLSDLELPADALYDSPKMMYLRTKLPNLLVR